MLITQVVKSIVSSVTYSEDVIQIELYANMLEQSLIDLDIDCRGLQNGQKDVNRTF